VFVCFVKSALANGNLFTPSACIEGRQWNTQYDKLQGSSWILVAFCVFQALAHHCGTSVIMEYISQGLLFSKHHSGKVAPGAVSTAQMSGVGAGVEKGALEGKGVGAGVAGLGNVEKTVSMSPNTST
jgi:Ni/Fe-hydrogenase subunit HybB-like protein